MPFVFFYNIATGIFSALEIVKLRPEWKVVLIEKGDKIVYKEYSTTEIKVDEKEYIILKEEDIDYGIYKEEGTNNVVITKEFSSKSPKKYSFKGFGILDEITR